MDVRCQEVEFFFHSCSNRSPALTPGKRIFFILLTHPQLVRRTKVSDHQTAQVQDGVTCHYPIPRYNWLVRRSQSPRHLILYHSLLGPQNISKVSSERLLLLIQNTVQPVKSSLNVQNALQSWNLTTEDGDPKSPMLSPQINQFSIWSTNKRLHIEDSASRLPISLKIKTSQYWLQQKK